MWSSPRISRARGTSPASSATSRGFTPSPRWRTSSRPRANGGRDMRFGVCAMANVDEIGFFNHAETLAYGSAWVTDSQMLFSDCYAVLALAAWQTTRLRLG